MCSLCKEEILAKLTGLERRRAAYELLKTALTDEEREHAFSVYNQLLVEGIREEAKTGSVKG